MKLVQGSQFWLFRNQQKNLWVSKSCKLKGGSEQVYPATDGVQNQAQMAQPQNPINVVPITQSLLQGVGERNQVRFILPRCCPCTMYGYEALSKDQIGQEMFKVTLKRSKCSLFLYASWNWFVYSNFQKIQFLKSSRSTCFICQNWNVYLKNQQIGHIKKRFCVFQPCLNPRLSFYEQTNSNQSKYYIGEPDFCFYCMSCKCDCFKNCSINCCQNCSINCCQNCSINCCQNCCSNCGCSICGNHYVHTIIRKSTDDTMVGEIVRMIPCACLKFCKRQHADMIVNIDDPSLYSFAMAALLYFNTR